MQLKLVATMVRIGGLVSWPNQLPVISSLTLFNIFRTYFLYVFHCTQLSPTPATLAEYVLCPHAQPEHRHASIHSVHRNPRNLPALLFYNVQVSLMHS